MRLSRAFALAVFAPFLAAGQTPAPSHKELLAKLDEVKQKVAAARVRCDIYEKSWRAPAPPRPPSGGMQMPPPPPADPSASTTPVHWAYSGEKRFFDMGDRSTAAWDGKTWRARSEGPDAQRQIGERMGTPARRIQDPIEAGYTMRVGRGRQAETLWLCDWVRRAEIKVSTLPDGKISLIRTATNEGGSRTTTVVADPAKDYLIESMTSKVTAIGQGDGGDRISIETRRIVNSQRVGDIWVPTEIQFEVRQGPSAPPVQTTSTRLENLSSDVPDSLFVNIFEPGEYVRKGDGHFRVEGDGSLAAISGTPIQDRESRETVRQFAYLVGGAILLAIVVFVVGRALKGPKTIDPGTTNEPSA